jgi:hypothetical protein
MEKPSLLRRTVQIRHLESGAIEVVITLNWRLQQRRAIAAGTVKLWRLDSNGKH